MVRIGKNHVLIKYFHFELLVPGPVSSLSATPEVVQLTLSWSPPSEPNGIITMYQVSHNISGVFNHTNTSATQLTLRYLPPSTAVTFSVRAYTIIGPGEAASNSTSTTDIRECRKLVNYMFIFIQIKHDNCGLAVA